MSESAESDEYEREDRPGFSFAPRSDAELRWEPAVDDKVRNGMFAGRREMFKEGIVKVVELYCSSPSVCGGGTCWDNVLGKWVPVGCNFRSTNV